MGEIAIVICNYNGEEYIIRCIDSLIQQDSQIADIYVVDNASTDNSINRIKEKYGTRIQIYINNDNLGGSGGFGRGIRESIKKNYKYIMLMDNDAVADDGIVGKMYHYLEQNQDVGMVGAKILQLNNSDKIMDYAPVLNFDKFIDECAWYNKEDSEEANIARECDFIAATCAMARTDVLKKIGGMDEEHFIYYDDIEMSYRIKLAGYKLISLGYVKAWHKSNMIQSPVNTFSRYYFTRNRYRFYAKYLPEDSISKFVDKIINDTFSSLFGLYKKKRMDLFVTTNYIFQDFIGDVRGKAKEGRIQKIYQSKEPVLEKLIKGKNSLLIYLFDGDNDKCLKRINEVVRFCNPQLKISISKEKCNKDIQISEESINGLNIDIIQQAFDKQYDLVIQLCNHVKYVKDNILPIIYVDEYTNAIIHIDDYYYFKSYNDMLALFDNMFRDKLKTTIEKIRLEKNKIF